MQKLYLLILSFFLLNVFSFGQTESSKLQITQLTGDFYIYTTWQSFNGTRFPANGMYVLTDNGVLLVDSPWDTTQFKPLLDSIRIKHNKNVVMCIATHSHEDRTAGLVYYRKKGIKTYTTKQTDSISQLREEPRAQYLITGDTTFRLGQHEFEVYYAGPGHTTDNIVVWFKKEKILYGGCLIKSTEAKDLGNLSDANVAAWPETIHKVQLKCGKPKYVIPGHQSWSNNQSLEHTLMLIEQYQLNKNK
ncbi:MAG: BlaB/IND/MUS family subclass B1 metallo-beta-lactamase [Cytophaga sp.]|uniref:BlaB/IND/MUS family subclass B1 metallo-beta-lactamase n=1 Tax=Cytophaga sp. TaxID=29535 RepID=UPI003F80F5EB